ncbi:NACHT domain-containing NTPase [Massilia sp. YMA4]|uniref:NACHT domain-containing protein n=1 Tax=Massilia sp. YMA4 TaxID=1593482 RepID=UPI000DD10138|nr:NACHT domain-containing protein [Massilia sp. YMA4]AXA90187.1 hypothetical protein DPH57_02790 [Massilia sp. YMA4]
MTGLETKMAVDVLKPASGFIDALLAPKIAKVRKWATEKDLESYFEGVDKLTLLLERYVERVINRASWISTLVFPQEKVPLGRLYEPVVLVRREGANGLRGRDVYELDLSAESLSVLIIDEAGMGKSTYAKHLCIEVCAKSDRIPILFDLASYESDKTLIENLAKDFDEIDYDFDRPLFRKLIVKGKFFVILDGFDEAPTETQDKIRSEIRSFNEKKGGTTLVITSRPQERMPSLAGGVNLSLRSLDEKQAISILERFDKLTGLTIGVRLKDELPQIPKRFLQTPLLVSLLYRTYGYNNSIAERISVFYSEIFEALYKGHDLTKSGYVRVKQSGLDIDKFRELLRAFSFLYIIKATGRQQSFDSLLDIVGEAQKLCSFPAVNARHFLDDLLLAVPLLSRDGLTLKFMHLSIAEYFAAEYLTHKENAKDFVSYIVGGPLSEKFIEVVEYLYEIAPSLYKEVVTVPIAKRFLSEKSTNVEDPIYQTLTFTDRWAISIWPYDEVVGEDNGVRLPTQPFSYSMATFMYGSVEDVQYVACCALSNRMAVPDGAWLDLTAKIRENIDEKRVNRDQDITDLVANFELNVWHLCDSALIQKNIGINALQSFLMSLFPFRNGRRFNARLGGVRVITVDKCDAAIHSLESLRGAESSIAEVLKGLAKPA